MSLAAVYCPWAPLRFVLALLPGLAFLRSPVGFPLIFSVLAWLYLILVLTAGRFSVWLHSYRRNYRAMLLLYLFSAVSSVILNSVTPGMLLLMPGMLYAAAFLYLGVFAMRRLQMNAEMGLRWDLANGAVVIGAPLLAAGCSLLLWQLLRLLEPVTVSLLPPLRRALAQLVNFFFPIDPAVPTPTERPRPTLSPAEAEDAAPEWTAPPQVGPDWELDPELLEKLRRLGLFVLLAVLAIAVLVLILVRVHRVRAKTEAGSLFEETEEGVRVKGQRRKAESRSGPAKARQIRALYRRYMLLMRKRGVPIRKVSTSREILDGAEQISLSPAARRLRELYLKARYGDGEAVTLGDVQEAALCLRQILDDEPKP